MADALTLLGIGVTIAGALAGGATIARAQPPPDDCIPAAFLQRLASAEAAIVNLQLRVAILENEAQSSRSQLGWPAAAVPAGTRVYY